MEQNNIVSYFSGLIATISSVRTVQELYNPILAFSFNSINFLRPGENKYSEILSFFLDPNQTHGQGNIFLKQFLKALSLEDKVQIDNYKNIRCQCEQGIENQRRIDLLITFGNNEFGIAIENKVWAIDQVNQLNDYNAYLKAQFGQNYCLLYLTPYQTAPDQKSINISILKELEEAGYYKEIGYTDHIIDCVHQWALNCRAERVRVFLLDFEQYLRTEFLGESFMEENQTIANYALKNLDNLEVALSTFNAIGEIKKRLLDIFKSQISEIATNNALEVDISEKLGLNENYQGFSFYKPEWRYVNIRFQFNAKNANSFGFGISHNESDKEKDTPIIIPELIANSILNKFKSHPGTNDWWLIFTYFEDNYGNWSNQSEPWLDILNGNMKTKIEALLKQYLETLSDLKL